MNKKLKKYIEEYLPIQNCKEYELMAYGGMTILVNQDTSCELVIEDNSYTIKEFQSILINALEKSFYIKAEKKINLIAIKFKAAGASFFYKQYLEDLMYNPNMPIFTEHISIDKIDMHLQDCFKPSTLPFNIMKIVDLLDAQGSEYKIDEVLAIANVPRKILDKLFRLHVGLSFKTYASLKEHNG